MEGRTVKRHRMILSCFLFAAICAGLFGIANWLLVGKTLHTWIALGLMFSFGWASCSMITRTGVLESPGTGAHEPIATRLKRASINPYSDVPNFIADGTALRTFDQETGFELIHDGGGSDGSMRFKIIGPASSCAFGAHMVVDRNSCNGLSVLVWEVYNWKKEWEPVIYGALRAYKSVHGCTNPTSQYFVCFGQKGSLINA